MKQIDFIKETDWKGVITYYTQVDGMYIIDSLSINEEKARSLFELIKKDGPDALKTKKEVIESIKVTIA